MTLRLKPKQKKTVFVFSCFLLLLFLLTFLPRHLLCVVIFCSQYCSGCTIVYVCTYVILFLPSRTVHREHEAFDLCSSSCRLTFYRLQCSLLCYFHIGGMLGVYGKMASCFRIELTGHGDLTIIIKINANSLRRIVSRALVPGTRSLNVSDLFVYVWARLISVLCKFAFVGEKTRT
jgi:hypothetical protein